MDLLTCTNTFVSHADRLIGLFSTFLVLLVLFSLLITFSLFSLLITFSLFSLFSTVFLFTVFHFFQRFGHRVGRQLHVQRGAENFASGGARLARQAHARGDECLCGVVW